MGGDCWAQLRSSLPPKQSHEQRRAAISQHHRQTALGQRLADICKVGHVFTPGSYVGATAQEAEIRKNLAGLGDKV